MKVFLSIALAVLVSSATSAEEVAEPPVCEPGVEFYPHPTDCTLFYQCSEGTPLLKECSPGLYWNAVLNTCDFPQASGCVSSTTASTGATTNDGSTTPTTTPNSTVTTSRTTTPTTGTGTSSSSTTGLPTETTTGTGNVTSSSSTTGLPTETTTGTGTGTSSSSTTGLPTETTTGTGTGTSSSSTTGIPTEEPPTEQTTGSTSTTTQEPATEPPGGLPESCPAVEDPLNVIRLPHESNCEFYYRCTSGVKVIYSCSTNGNVHFSPTLRICQDAYVAGCDRCPTIEDISHVVRLPHETDCHLYYLCEDGKKSLYQCRLDWQFSRNIRECLEAEQAQCALRK